MAEKKKYVVRIGTEWEVFEDGRSEQIFDDLKTARWHAAKWCEEDRQEELMYEIISYTDTPLDDDAILEGDYAYSHELVRAVSGRSDWNREEAR